MVFSPRSRPTIGPCGQAVAPGRSTRPCAAYGHPEAAPAACPRSSFAPSKVPPSACALSGMRRWGDLLTASPDRPLRNTSWPSTRPRYEGRPARPHPGRRGAARAAGGELSGILAWIEQLNEVDTEGVAPMASTEAVSLPMRDDVVTDGGDPASDPGQRTKGRPQLLRGAEGGRILLPPWRVALRALTDLTLRGRRFPLAGGVAGEGASATDARRWGNVMSELTGLTLKGALEGLKARRFSADAQRTWTPSPPRAASTPTCWRRRRRRWPWRGRPTRGWRGARAGRWKAPRSASRTCSAPRASARPPVRRSWATSSRPTNPPSPPTSGATAR